MTCSLRQAQDDKLEDCQIIGDCRAELVEALAGGLIVNLEKQEDCLKAFDKLRMTN